MIIGGEFQIDDYISHSSDHLLLFLPISIFECFPLLISPYCCTAHFQSNGVLKTMSSTRVAYDWEVTNNREYDDLSLSSSKSKDELNFAIFVIFIFRITDQENTIGWIYAQHESHELCKLKRLF